MSGPNWPEIIELDTNTWAMLYFDKSDLSKINYATSPKADPHNWTKQAGSILTATTIRGCGVIKDGTTYHMLYDTLGELCYASGTDLTSLTKYSETNVPVFSGQGVGWERYVRHPTLLKVGATYHMIYDGRQDGAAGEIGAIGHATSPDMVTWTRDPANPILSPSTAEWERSDVCTPHLFLSGGTYYLFYSGYDGLGTPYIHRIGYATSTNLSTWTKFSGNPILELGSYAAWDGHSVDGPSMMNTGAALYLYYAGSYNDVEKIGYATWTP